MIIITYLFGKELIFLINTETSRIKLTKKLRAKNFIKDEIKSFLKSFG